MVIKSHTGLNIKLAWKSQKVTPHNAHFVFKKKYFLLLIFKIKIHMESIHIECTIQQMVL